MSKQSKAYPQFKSEAAERRFREARDVPYQSPIKVWLEEKSEEVSVMNR